MLQHSTNGAHVIFGENTFGTPELQVRELRSSKLAPGKNKVFTAGEKEYISEIERKEIGIPINKSLQKDIKIMKRELKLDNYDFPF